MMLPASFNIILFALFDYGTIANVIHCSGDTNKCQDTTINCLSNENCIISCNGTSSCRDTIISGPIDANLTIHCNGEQSCFGAIFNGSAVSQLNITGCIDYESCLHISLYCPSTSKPSKNCMISGNDNLGGNITIYTINGWNDIDIDYNGAADTIHSGQMFCGSYSNISCAIAPDDWSCINTNDYCNNKMDIQVFDHIHKVITTTSNSSIEVIFNMHRDKNEGMMEMMIVVVSLAIMGISWIICGIIRHKCKQHVIRKASVISNSDMQFADSSDDEIIEDIEMTMNRTPTVATNYAE